MRYSTSKKLPLTPASEHFLRANAQVCKLDLAKNGVRPQYDSSKAMKTTTLTIILICVYGLTSGQVKTLKVKKPTKQSEMSSVVTWCGLYYGKVTVTDMLADKKLKISNNKENIEIISSDITFFIRGGGAHMISQAGDSISELAIDEILKLDPEKNTLIFISSIKAVTKNQDTLYLNPIDLKLEK